MPKIDKTSITSELGNSEELVMSQKGVTDEFQLAGEVSNAILINTEEALANVLNTMRGEINALKQVIAQGIFTKAQIGEADIQKLRYQGSEMTLSGVGAPSVIPVKGRMCRYKIWESVEFHQ